MEFGVIVYLFTGLREWGMGAMYPPPHVSKDKNEGWDYIWREARLYLNRLWKVWLHVWGSPEQQLHPARSGDSMEIRIPK